MMLYTALMTWFVVDYLYNEHVHLYTFDFFAERVRSKHSPSTQTALSPSMQPPPSFFCGF